MRFNFRLKTLLRQRKVEQDVAQRDYAIAQHAVSEQLGKIKRMYEDSDEARQRKMLSQQESAVNSAQLNQYEEYIEGMKSKILLARHRARELMSIAEEKHEILVEKVKDYKIIEKLQERKLAEFKKARSKRSAQQFDDLTIMKNYKKDGRL